MVPVENWQALISGGRLATVACLLELAAAKPGNVHRGADFEETTFIDFMMSAVGLGEAIDQLAERPLGELILSAVKQTETLAGSNTNLGIILLLGPLAKCDADELQSTHVEELLNRLTRQDCIDVFEAIRIAKPGGLGTSQQMDVTSNATIDHDLITAMQFASDQDMIAKQYANGFQQVFGEVQDALEKGLDLFGNVCDGIVYAHINVMATFPDSLIARKCGADTAEQSRLMAGNVIECLTDSQSSRTNYWNAVSELDFWLRSDGNRRNPGTTADLIVAAIYVALRNGKLTPPF